MVNLVLKLFSRPQFILIQQTTIYSTILLMKVCSNFSRGHLISF
uniref:Uncharacterized protein n=1 Tax=Arundo donax TaxID=35708 RepID=A0A0A9F4G8_ARUDO